MIDLLPSEVEQQIIDGVAGFLAEELPLARLRPGPDGERSADIGISAEQWHEIAGLGWFGLGIPEERGGAGFTVVAEMLVVREVGRYAVSPSISATIAAASSLASPFTMRRPRRTAKPSSTSVGSSVQSQRLALTQTGRTSTS